MLDYTQSAALTVDPEFGGRVKVACLKLAVNINNEPTTVAGHTSRFRWAQDTIRNPIAAQQQVQPPTVLHPAVQDLGAAIDDSTLQFAVEQTVAQML